MRKILDHITLQTSTGKKAMGVLINALFRASNALEPTVTLQFLIEI